MKTMPFHRYAPFTRVQLEDRIWPSKIIDVAPMWCSVDLRDGNQALIEPMSIEKKCRMFDLLVQMGFKQIEVGFPAAAKVEFEFVRTLIEKQMIPDDVVIQVLTPARDEIIRRTFEAVRGAKQVIIHLYNSTSTLQRRVVFGLDKQGVIDLVVPRARLIKQLASNQTDTKWMFQYSPESFTGTELDFACEICSEVIDVWQPTPDNKVIINLPATVEMSTPNVYADMIEWMSRNLSRRDSVLISLHPHNDRGTGIAAAELGMMAGGERIEGTLFGNGERTGNVDIVTLALNLMTQGVDPKLDISDVIEIVRIAEECTGIGVHPRHPYSGEIAYTAFSGSHQDAIKKGRDSLQDSDSCHWEVPYLPIDPGDIGRSYQGIVRINSQSGKGGVAYIMDREHNLQLPRGLQIDFSSVVQKETERSGVEMQPSDLWRLFQATYLDANRQLELVEYVDRPGEIGRKIDLTVLVNGVLHEIEGLGNGPLDAFMNALKDFYYIDVSVMSYNEQAVSGGSGAQAIAYIAIHVPGSDPVWGVGLDTDITKASLLAIASAVNRSYVVLSQ